MKRDSKIVSLITGRRASEEVQVQDQNLEQSMFGATMEPTEQTREGGKFQTLCYYHLIALNIMLHYLHTIQYYQ